MKIPQSKFLITHFSLLLRTCSLFLTASKKFPKIQLCLRYTTCDVMIGKHPRKKELIEVRYV